MSGKETQIPRVPTRKILLTLHEIRVHYFRMKNITLSADEFLIQQARVRAASENRSLNDLFREWLAQYVSQPQAAQKYIELMTQLNHVQASGPYTRDEMNER